MSALMAQADREVALAAARDLLLVKAGKFADRPLEPAHLIEVARWILYGDDPEVVTVDLTGSPQASWVADQIREQIDKRSSRNGRGPGGLL